MAWWQCSNDKLNQKIVKDLHDLKVYGSGLLHLFKELEERMAVDFSKLRAEVAENKSVMESAAALLMDIKAKLDDALEAGDDSAVVAAVEEIAAEMDAQTDVLAAAVAANTPADPLEPAPPVDPVPPAEESPPA